MHKIILFITCLILALPAQAQIIVGQSFAPAASGESDWDIADASYDSKFCSVASETGNPEDVLFNDDGTKMFVVDPDSDRVLPYTLSTAWDVSTCSYDGDGNILSVTSQETGPRGAFWKPDGTVLYVNGNTGDDVNQYGCSSAFVLTTCTFSAAVSTGTQDNNPQSVFWEDDGTNMFVIGIENDSVSEYSCSTPWTNTSCSITDSTALSEDGQPRGIWFKPDGLAMWMAGDSNNTIFQYTLSSAWDASTLSYDSVSFSTASQATFIMDVEFGDEGRKMYVTSGTDDRIYQYSVN